MQWLRRLFRKPKPDFVLEHSDSHFSYVKGDKIMRSVRFDDIKRIEAYKIDQVTVDMICFDVWHQTSDGIDGLTLHEDIEGFNDLERKLSKLDGYDEAWQLKVITPAFEERRMVIYQTEQVTG